MLTFVELGCLSPHVYLLVEHQWKWAFLKARQLASFCVLASCHCQ